MDRKAEPGSDEFLIAHVSTGNEDAFEEIVRRHQVKVLNLIHYFINDRFSAEDIAQEVFLKVWKNAASFKGISKFSTWLYRIVVNLCLNHKRTLKKEAYRQDSLPGPGNDFEYGEPVENPDSSPHQSMEKKERESVINQALRLLPSKQRMALVLSRFEGYSYTEIAELMKTSIPAVESLLFRAKQNLCRFLFPLKEKGEL